MVRYLLPLHFDAWDLEDIKWPKIKQLTPSRNTREKAKALAQWLIEQNISENTIYVRADIRRQLLKKPAGTTAE